MKWIGLTGGIASGKSTVAQLLRDAQIPVIDADEIARGVVAQGGEGLTKVVSHFGQQILNSDGSLNRKKLGQKVFGRPEELRVLENILHPLVKAETTRRRQSLEQQNLPVAIYDVPLLFEKKDGV